MKQYTITYRGKYGVKFAFVDAMTADSAIRQTRDRETGAPITVLTVRENVTPLQTVTEITEVRQK